MGAAMDETFEATKKLVPCLSVCNVNESQCGRGNGVFKADRKGHIISVVSPGDPAPGGGTFDFVLWGSAINNRGDVAFFGHTTDEPCVTLFPQADLIHCLNNSLYIKRANGAIEWTSAPRTLPLARVLAEACAARWPARWGQS